MTYAKKTCVGVLCGLCLLPWGALPAQASDACSVREAKRDVAQARRALVRAAVRYREARHVLSETRRYLSLYGPGVSRWTRLARRVGWPWPQFPQLMLVINRESRGDPCARNPASGASGLLQFLPPWSNGEWGLPAFDPYSPRQNLSAGVRVWRAQGWTPWAL